MYYTIKNIKKKNKTKKKMNQLFFGFFHFIFFFLIFIVYIVYLSFNGHIAVNLNYWVHELIYYVINGLTTSFIQWKI